MGALVAELLGHDELRRRRRRDLRQVRDAKHLVTLAQRTHFRADGVGDLAAHVGVDLVENQQRNGVLARERRFHRQHDARNFPARRDGFERLERFAGIRGEEKFHGLQTVRARFFQRAERHLEAAFLKSEIAKLAADVGGELRRGGFAFCGKFPPSGKQGAPRSFDFTGQPREFVAARFDLA